MQGYSSFERVVLRKACPDRLMASNPVQELTRYVCVGLIKYWGFSLFARNIPKALICDGYAICIYPMPATRYLLGVLLSSH